MISDRNHTAHEPSLKHFLLAANSGPSIISNLSTN